MIKNNTKEIVKDLLLNRNHLRDDDNKLISSYWWLELKKKNIDINKLTALDFLEMYSRGNLTNAESIRRVRAKLQEDNESLRGSKYYKRKGKIQDKWKQELGYRSE